MKLNSDFSKRVVVKCDRLEWQPSPMAGVERRMLDRIGGEVARATTIVRYAPNSKFSRHVHIELPVNQGQWKKPIRDRKFWI